MQAVAPMRPWRRDDPKCDRGARLVAGAVHLVLVAIAVHHGTSEGGAYTT